MVMCINDYDYLTSDLSIYCTRYSSVVDIQAYLQYRFYPFNTDDTAEPISIVRTRSVIFNFNGKKKDWSHRWYLKAINCDLIRHTVIADRLNSKMIVCTT